MELPNTVQELVLALLTDVVFLGTVATALTAGLLTLLKTKFNWVMGDNWKRTIAIGVAMLLTTLAYFFGVFREFFSYSDDGLYNAIVVGVKGGLVSFASLAAYTAYRGAKTAVNKARRVPNKRGE